MVPHWISEMNDHLKHEETKFLIIALTYMSLIATAALLSSKVASFGPFLFSVGVFPYSLSFTLTDAIGEIWGKQKAKRVVTAGLFGMVGIYLFIFLAIHSPAAPFWEMQAPYSKIFTVSARVLFAGFIAYVAAQYHDVWLFAFLKWLTKDKYLWLRNTVSTTVSQLIDTAIIAGIGFYGVIPSRDLPFIVFGWWLIKVAIAILDTPIIYLLVLWLRGRRIEPKITWLASRAQKPTE